MGDVHIHIGEIVVDGPFDAGAFEATLHELASSYAGDYPSGSASVLHGQPAASVAESVWHSIVPDGGGQ